MSCYSHSKFSSSANITFSNGTHLKKFSEGNKIVERNHASRIFKHVKIYFYQNCTNFTLSFPQFIPTQLPDQSDPIPKDHKELLRPPSCLQDYQYGTNNILNKGWSNKFYKDSIYFLILNLILFVNHLEN